MAMQRVMAARLAASFMRQLQQNGTVRSISTTAPVMDGPDHHDGPAKAGNREVVGYGTCGEPYYVDRLDFPYPAIRFQVRDQPGISALQQKEQGDWKSMSVDEKKALYRHSFCQTFVEVTAPNGLWKCEWALVCWCLTATLVYYCWLKFYVYGDLVETMSEEWREASLQRMIDTHAEPITGVSSKWDYEKKQWKA